MGTEASLSFARRVRWLRRLLLATVLTGPCCSGDAQPSASTKAPPEPVAPKPPPAPAGPTPEVSGPSWLSHLHLTVIATKLGRQGADGEPPQRPQRQPVPDAAHTNVRFTLSGADVYRYSCRACHGPEGLGAPDEIPSLIPFIQGMSPSLLGARMSEQGHPMKEELLAELAAGGESALRTRLKAGGLKMPPFSHLHADEEDALIAYLKQLADAPATERPATMLEEPAVRVGELLVKGTCHVCHAATGPGSPHLTMMQRTIPSLATFTSAYGVEQLVHKVRLGQGAMSGMHGAMMAKPGNDEMPVFPYLTEQEVAAARNYLVAHPPSPADRWPRLPEPAP